MIVGHTYTHALQFYVRGEWINVAVGDEKQIALCVGVVVNPMNAWHHLRAYYLHCSSMDEF